MNKAVRCRYYWLCLFLVLPFMSLAQMPVLKIDDKEDPNVLLSRLSVDVKVAGHIATTTMVMVFRNTSNRLLEGQLVFPLPEGVTVSRYALDFNGQLREAVPVEKVKGTQVFESIEQRRVDPGLLEQVSGNNFRTRIYPLPAHGTRTIVIGYEEPLRFNNKQSLRYHLPLDYKRSIDQFNLTISVLQLAVKPEVEEEPGNLQFNEWNHNYTASINRNNFTPAESLTLNIPKSKEHTEVIMQKAGANYYFLVNCFPQKNTRPKQRPRHITLLWDVSLSGLNRNIKKELQLLSRYLQQTGTTRVTLATINNQFKQLATYTIEDGNDEDLQKVIEQLPYDGGTAYNKIQFPPAEEYLFFTDGMASLDNATMPLPGKPVYTITSAARADFSYLQYVAQKTGGSLINLNELGVQEAEQLLNSQPLQFIGIKANRTISETYPSVPTTVNNQFALAGISTQPDATLTLQFGYGTTVTTEKTITLDYSKQVMEQVNLPRTWAQQKIAELDIQYQVNKEMITWLGKQYGLITRNTSLIVLETVHDYVQYDIEPPAELRDQYDRIIKQQLATRQTQQHIAFTNALQQLNNLMDWWNKPLPQTAKVPAAEPLQTTQPVQVPSPTQAAATMRRDSMRTRRNDNTTLEAVVVTGYGTQKKRSIAGSVTTVRAEEISSAPPAHLNTALEGKVMGVSVGSGSNIIIRGQSSLKNKTSDVTHYRPAYNDEKSGAASIDIKQWTPDRTYLNAIAKEKPAHQYERYLALRKEYLYTPTFYYDMAGFFFGQKDTITGLQVLTNMAEIDIENHELYKLLGYKLRETGDYQGAIHIFKKVLDWRPQEPHSYRDYALALQDAGYYQQALDTFYTAIMKNYVTATAGLYPGFEEIIVTEMNQLIALRGNKLDLSEIDPKLIHAMPVDVRVVLNWNKNNTDIDLWVTDPNNEKCYYSHKNTAIGGRISNDFTRGYGPEQFMLKKAIRGNYKVQIHYYGDSQFTLSGPTTVMAEIYTHYANGTQHRKLISLQMEKNQQSSGILVGEFSFTD
jgi:tetratricopeptide (TPR) repeat protein